MKFISVGVLALAVASTSAIKSPPESVSLFATGMDPDAFMDEEITIKGEVFHFLQKKNKKGAKKFKDVRLIQDDEAPAGGKPAGYETVDDQSEKVSVLQTPISAHRTTFYNAKKTKNQSEI